MSHPQLKQPPSALNNVGRHMKWPYCCKDWSTLIRGEGGNLANGVLSSFSAKLIQKMLQCPNTFATDCGQSKNYLGNSMTTQISTTSNCFVFSLWVQDADFCDQGPKQCYCTCISVARLSFQNRALQIAQGHSNSHTCWNTPSLLLSFPSCSSRLLDLWEEMQGKTSSFKPEIKKWKIQDHASVSQ